MAQPDSGSSAESSPEPLFLEVAGEPLLITNFRTEFPPAAPAKDRVDFVNAGTKRGLALHEDGLHAAARVFVRPAVAKRVVDNDLLTEKTAGTAWLLIVEQLAYLTELLPLVQPRAGAAARNVDPPGTTGYVERDKAGNEVPLAMTVLRFRDKEHLIAQVSQAVRHTLSMGRDYSASILAKRVTQPGLAHVVRIEFDTGEYFYISIPRDGITRVVSSWRAIYPNLNSDQLADRIVTTVLASKSSRRAQDTLTAEHARGRDEQQKALRAQFAAGMATGRPNEAAIRIGQALTLPMQMIVGFEVGPSAAVPVAQQFDDVVQGLVASSHGEFEPWEKSASDAAAILRALPRVVNDGRLKESIADMAAGYLPVKDVPKVFDDDAPATALWRAVYVVAWLSDPWVFDALKRHLRDLLGVAQIHKPTYASHLMTLVDLPWRSAKASTRLQSLRAWGNGGPVPHDLLGVEWDPTPTPDFTTLVPKALEDDLNARATLQVAGGIALVTDKLLMSNRGSAVTSGEVTFRANVNDVVDNLGKSEAGLWLLARAANAFDPDTRALNSYTPTELVNNPPAKAYVVPAIDRKRPGNLATDNSGQPERLLPYDVVEISNPAKAAAETAGRVAKAAAKRRAASETNNEKAERLRGELDMHLTGALNGLEELIALGDIDGALQPLLVDTETWQRLIGTTHKLSGKLFNLEPPKPTYTADSEDEDEDDDLEDGVA